MKYTSKSLTSTPEILKRTRGQEIIVPITVASSVFTNTNVCKAGTPLASNGTIANTSSAKGILLNDVYVENPNGALITAFADVNLANAEANSGLTISADVKTALKNVVFE